MSTIVLIIVFVLLCLFIVIATEVRARRRSSLSQHNSLKSSNAQYEEVTDSSDAPIPADTTCCGRHAVCENSSLLSSKPDIVYYDDEELDALKGRSADSFTEEERERVEEVFRTMAEADVAGWLRSLQLRDITLPSDILEEALLIVADRRNAKA